MTKRIAVTLFLAVLAFLWLVPQAQAQYRRYMPRSSRWQSCNTPYQSYCLEDYYGGYYQSPYSRRYRRGRSALDTIIRIGAPVAAYAFGEHQGQDRGRREGYETALYEEHLRRVQEIRRQEAQEQELQEQSRERQAPRDLIPMTNRSFFLAIVYDGDTEVARLKPGEFKNLPEPESEDGYKAKLRTIVGNRVHYEAVSVSHNKTHSGWEINEPEKE